MRFFGHEIKTFAQWLVFFVTVLLIAFGMCGVQFVVVTSAGQSLGPIGGPVIALGYLELAVMLLSLLGIIVVLILWTIATVLGWQTKRIKDGPLRLFNNSDDEDNSDETKNRRD